MAASIDRASAVVLQEHALSKGANVEIVGAGTCERILGRLRRRDRFGRYGCEIDTCGNTFGGLDSIASPASMSTTVASEAAGSIVRGQTKYVSAENVLPICVEKSKDDRMWESVQNELVESRLVFYPSGSIKILFALSDFEDTFAGYFMNLMQPGLPLCLEDGRIIGEIASALPPKRNSRGSISLASPSVINVASGDRLCVMSQDGRIQKTDLVVNPIIGGGVVPCFCSHPSNGTHSGVIVYICSGKGAASHLRARECSSSFNPQMVSAYDALSSRLCAAGVLSSAGDAAASRVDVCFVSESDWLSAEESKNMRPWWSHLPTPPGTVFALLPTNADVTVEVETVVLADGTVLKNIDADGAINSMLSSASFQVSQDSREPQEVFLLSSQSGECSVNAKLRKARSVEGATRIQAQWRKRKAVQICKQRKREERSATDLQRIYRGFCGRKYAEEVHKHVIIAAAQNHEQEFQTVDMDPWDRLSSPEPDAHVTEKMRRRHMKQHKKRKEQGRSKQKDRKQRSKSQDKARRKSRKSDHGDHSEEAYARNNDDANAKREKEERRRRRQRRREKREKKRKRKGSAKRRRAIVVEDLGMRPCGRI